MTDDPVPETPPDGLETDERFPSGPWEGFFLQPILAPGKHWMELILTFRDGTVHGEGRDRVGTFLVTGRYTVEDGKCWWTKRYVGRHDVFYKGYNEGKGIWGLWELKILPWRGGFHIWPVGMGDPTRQRLAEAVETPVEAPSEPSPVKDLEPVGAGTGEGTTSDQRIGSAVMFLDYDAVSPDRWRPRGMGPAPIPRIPVPDLLWPMESGGSADGGRPSGCGRGCRIGSTPSS